MATPTDWSDATRPLSQTSPRSCSNSSAVEATSTWYAPWSTPLAVDSSCQPRRGWRTSRPRGVTEYSVVSELTRIGADTLLRLRFVNSTGQSKVIRKHTHFERVSSTVQGAARSLL